MPACRILSLARTSRLPMAAGDSEERRRDRLRVQSEHHLQNQRRANAGLDRRMRAGEHQRETLVRNLRAACRRVQPFRHRPATARLPSRRGVVRRNSIDHLSPRDGQQPRFRVRRTALHAANPPAPTRTPPTARPRRRPRRACVPRERRRACRSCGARPRPPCYAPASSPSREFMRLLRHAPRADAPRPRREPRPGSGPPTRSRHPDRARR